MRILFVRHGHPNYEKDCLTELGHKHAKAAALRLQGEGIEQIFSSTCGRAYETAQYTANMLGLPIEKCDFMREISWGSIDNQPLFSGGHPWDTVDKMVTDRESLLCPDWMEKEPFCRNKMTDCVRNIESKTDAWLEKLGYTREGMYYRVTGDTKRTIAAFGHGGASAAVFGHLFGLPFPFVCSNMRLDYTGITVVTLADEKGALVTPRFEILNDARHIKDLKTSNIYDC